MEMFQAFYLHILYYFVGKFEKFSTFKFGNRLKDHTQLDTTKDHKKMAQTFRFAWHVSKHGGTTPLECLEDGHAKYEALF